jgi:hypothetical protein
MNTGQKSKSTLPRVMLILPVKLQVAEYVLSFLHQVSFPYIQTN